jgi:TRAP-type C4-dicarboxylate transport system permease small subunit
MSRPSAAARCVAYLDRVSARAADALFKLGVFGALPALLCLVNVDVLLRYLFKAPLQWSGDANGLLLLVALFSALPAAWDRGHHIRMEILYLRLPARWRVAADALSALAGIVFFGLLTAQAALYTPYMAYIGETGEELATPLWPFMAFIAVCGAVFVARLIANPTATRNGAAAGGQSWI